MTHPQQEVLEQQFLPAWVLLLEEQGPLLVSWTPQVHQQGHQLEIQYYHEHRDVKAKVRDEMQ